MPSTGRNTNSFHSKYNTKHYSILGKQIIWVYKIPFKHYLQMLPLTPHIYTLYNLSCRSIFTNV